MTSAEPRVLMLAPYCYPATGAEAIVTSKLAVALLEAGWQVTVLTDSEAGRFYPATNLERFKVL